MIGRDGEFTFRPAFYRGEIVRATNQAKIEQAVANRRLAGIALAQELQDDAIAKAVR